MINYLIFDGNYIMHKSVQALKSTNRFYEGLYRLMELTIEKYVKMNSWDKVIIVSDSRKKSWRTKLKTDYKGTRQRDESIDWDFVYETYSLFKEEMAQKYIVIEQDHIEGDDWILFLNRYANKQGKGTCVISSDKDLFQLIKYNTKKEYMNIQIADKANDEKMFIPIGWEILYDQITKSDSLHDLFNLNNTNDNISFFDFCRNNFTVKEINNTQHLFEKILTGDKGDNVKSVHLQMTKTGNSLRGIGDKTAPKVWQHYNNIYDTFDTTNETDLRNMIESYTTVKKLDLSKSIQDTIYNNIVDNINIMELHPRVFPNDIKYQITDKILDILEPNE